MLNFDSFYLSYAGSNAFLVIFWYFKFCAIFCMFLQEYLIFAISYIQ